MGKIQDNIEFYAFISSVKLFRCLPNKITIKMLKAIFYIAGYVCGIRKKVVTSQLRRCFPEKTKKEIANITKNIYSELATTAAEVFVLDEKYIKQRTEIIGYENVTQALALKRGLIIISAHFANWELGAKILAEKSPPIYGIAKQQRNKRFNEYIKKTRQAAGVETFGMRNGIKPLISALKKNHIVAMLIDQYAQRQGTEVEFLGHKTKAYTSHAQIILKYKTPIIIAFDMRDKAGNHQFVFDAPIHFDTLEYNEQNIIEVTYKINAHIEEQIRKHPHLWFWVHKKWRK